MVLGAIATSVLASLAFFVALVWAFVSQDPTSIDLLIGAVIANFSTAVSYWLGSSSSSARKDDIIAAAPPVGPALG